MRVAWLWVALLGCAPGIKVVRYTAPPKLDPGPSGPMVVEVTGTETALPMIQPALERAAQRELGFEVVQERAPGVAVLSAQVERWWQDVPQVTQAGSGRPPPMQTTEFMQLVVTLTKADGSTLSAHYESTTRDSPRERANPGGNSGLAAENARQLVKQFLGDFAPESTTESVDFDEDASTAAGLQLARAGDLPGAEQAWRAAGSAPARYNVGALLEARGALGEALAEYEAARGLSPDPKYARAAEAAKRSLALARRVRGGP